jgi:SAM-dependent methyltransferase
VARLPHLPAGHPLHREWLARADSSRRLLTYLGAFDGPLTIVDAGSGSGWLSAAMASLPRTSVLGIDANDVELAQARRVFGDRPNLRFTQGDLMDMPPPEPADVVVLASVIQYEADLAALVARLRSWLAEAGELHVFDSPIYRPEDVAAARDRSRLHYASIGVPEMADAYHHHTWLDLDPFAPVVLNRPQPSAGRLLRRLAGRVETPFPWLVIRAEVPA